MALSAGRRMRPASASRYANKACPLQSRETSLRKKTGKLIILCRSDQAHDYMLAVLMSSKLGNW